MSIFPTSFLWPLIMLDPNYLDLSGPSYCSLCFLLYPSCILSRVLLGQKLEFYVCPVDIVYFCLMLRCFTALNGRLNMIKIIKNCSSVIVSKWDSTHSNRCITSYYRYTTKSNSADVSQVLVTFNKGYMNEFYCCGIPFSGVNFVHFALTFEINC